MRGIRADCAEDLGCSPLDVFEALGERLRIAGVQLGMVTSDLLSRFSFQASQNLHVAPEARRTTGQMFADFCVAGLHGTLSHALEVGIWGATNTLTVGKGF
jgi:hypothetical protein